MVLLFLTRQVVHLPFAVRDGLWRLIFGRRRIPRQRLSAILPQVGLDERKLQSIIFDLRQDAADPELVEAWLTATQLAQITARRLLRDMRTVELNLEYWRASSQSRFPGWLMFVHRGPTQAFMRLANVFRRRPRDVLPASGMIDERLLVLQMQETLLLRSIAEVYEASKGLRVDIMEDGDEPDLAKRTHIRVNEALTKISNTLRKLKFENHQIQDIDIIERRMQGSPVNGVPETGASADMNDIFSHEIVEEIPKDSHEAGYSVTILLVLIAKIKDHLKIDVQCSTNTSLVRVLEEASVYSIRADPIVPVPGWARRPNRYQRHWIRYSITAIITSSIFRFLYSHSPLSGSDAMYRWLDSAKFALQAHLIVPLRNLAEEVFDMFHGSPGIVSREDYESSKESLLRMLKEFKTDNADRNRNQSSEDIASSGGDSVLEGMDVLMRTYENELKNPLRNAFIGQLARALLIQVQKLKTDTESAMLQLDQILRANELNVALVAAIPAIIVGGGLLYILYAILFNRSGPDPRRSLIPCRLALAELQRALDHCMEKTAEDALANGHMLYLLDKTYRACWDVFKNRDLVSSKSEWPSLRKDFLDLAQPLSIEQKLRICERMRVTYTVFRAQGPKSLFQ